MDEMDVLSQLVGQNDLAMAMSQGNWMARYLPEYVRVHERINHLLDQWDLVHG